MPDGRLTVVGTGLITPQHITQETKRHIEAADRVYYIVPDPLGVSYLQSLNSNLEYLGDCYEQTNNRADTYTLMADRIMQGVREDLSVVAVFYGHPGVFVSPSHKAINLAKAEGYSAKMLPGVSAEDCLYADLGIDPCKHGTQSHEATYFLIYQTNIDPYSNFIVWQLGVVGDTSYSSTNVQPSEDGLLQLKNKLLNYYSSDHKVAIYEAATLPTFHPRIEWLTLNDLDNASISQISTLFIPAVYPRLREDNYQ